MEKLLFAAPPLSCASAPLHCILDSRVVHGVCCRPPHHAPSLGTAEGCDGNSHDRMRGCCVPHAPTPASCVSRRRCGWVPRYRGVYSRERNDLHPDKKHTNADTVISTKKKPVRLQETATTHADLDARSAFLLRPCSPLSPCKFCSLRFVSSSRCRTCLSLASLPVFVPLPY